jgi:hypothetical protein
MTFTDKQQGVKQGVITGAIITIAGLGAGIIFIPTSLALDSSTADRLAYALKTEILVIFWLIYCIGKLGNHRFNTPEDIDGGGLTTGTGKAKILQAVLQNTLEQTVLAIVVHMIWAVVMPITWITGVLAAAILFSLGRLLFIRGYSGGASARALGFALTFYPSIIMLLATFITIVLGLLRLL